MPLDLEIIAAASYGAYSQAGDEIVCKDGLHAEIPGLPFPTSSVQVGLSHGEDAFRLPISCSDLPGYGGCPGRSKGSGVTWLSSVRFRCLLAGPPNPRARPYRVSNWNRTLRKGVVAESLQDLLEKICTTLPVFGSITLVLEEDGTTVDTEEFFQTLPDGTVFLALTKGQSWRPVKAPGDRLSRSRKPRGCHDIACVTLDLYKTRPQDFIGCLNFRATLFGVYSVSYDMRCCGARRVAKEALRWTLYAMQATGHVLLGASSYVQQLLDSTEEAVEKDNSSVVLHRLGSLPSRNMLE